ncbi:hypothetical protein EDD28_2116 [Salana multivorans]|uniref:MarR family transcriptional regulator n=1 Tax=Salana multivorans TaxID=120377 RepID=A0A3N2DCP8_9MICO|nr:hypothetical protein [Salana multivorans]MBN8882656.1 hypothetical protein [Salana multivorans]ROR97517.1 hypothetical protein EDD28_2116 [Salana multivorans]
MSEDDGEAITTAACFRPGPLGARLTRGFSERVERIGITHRQVGLLDVVAER